MGCNINEWMFINEALHSSTTGSRRPVRDASPEAAGDPGGDRQQRTLQGRRRQARKTLVDLIRMLRPRPLPEPELEPLAELLSMGQASVVLWWLEGQAASRDSIIDAIARVWHGMLVS